MWRFSCCLLVVSFFVMGCSSGQSRDTPPDIRYGEDICDQCRMIISEARFAAGYVTTDGRQRRFDDIGDMLLFHAEHAEEVAAFWVHDYKREEWIRAETAFFVVSRALPTPMGHGVVAFRNEQQARDLADKVAGKVLRFDDLQEHLVAQHGSTGYRHHHQNQMQ
ncbi:MAG: hypothetical protein D6736_11855 [Nitrospinota bacterium]|nr:MAG: hypothetical protein D6736_11855 [Nitrospinota bacterium]